MPFPRRYGRWVARADVVAYLEKYVEHHHLRVQTGVEVTRIAPGDDGRWLLRRRARASMSAPRGRRRDRLQPHARPADLARARSTARSCTPRRTGTPTPYAGRDVLVVGVGNTGAEIAVDLTEGGASRVRLAVRTAAAHRPPLQLRLARAGHRASSCAACPVRAWSTSSPASSRASRCPTCRRTGLPRPTTGLYSRVLEGSVPLPGRRADRGRAVGTGRAGRGRRRRSTAPEVVLADGSRVDPGRRRCSRRATAAVSSRWSGTWACSTTAACPRGRCPACTSPGSPTRSAACSASCASTPSRSPGPCRGADSSSPRPVGPGPAPRRRADSAGRREFGPLSSRTRAEPPTSPCARAALGARAAG